MMMRGQDKAALIHVYDELFDWKDNGSVAARAAMKSDLFDEIIDLTTLSMDDINDLRDGNDKLVPTKMWRML